MPRFTVIVPTTRGHLLPGALGSLMAQDYDDFEVVVVDNQAENAAEMIARHGDARVRRVVTERRLSMPDNWEFAFQQVRGDYALWLCDDDALVPQTLSTLAAAADRHPEIKVFNWRYGNYVYDQKLFSAQARQMSLPTFTGEQLRLPHEPLLQLYFQMPEVGIMDRIKTYLPSIMHACFHRSVYEQARREAGRLFWPLYPDFASAYMALALVPEQLYISEPLTIYGSTEDCNGVAAIGNTATFNRFYDEIGGKLFEHVPLKARYLTRSGIIETLLKVRAALPGRLGQYEYDWDRYFEGCFLELRFMKANGMDMSAEEAEYYAAVATQPADRQARLKRFIARADREVMAGDPHHRPPRYISAWRRLSDYLSRPRRARYPSGTWKDLPDIVAAARLAGAEIAQFRAAHPKLMAQVAPRVTLGKRQQLVPITT